MPRPSIYRQEALEHYARIHQEGEVLRISPEWVQVTYWLLVALVAVALLYCGLVSFDHYAGGPALVRFEERVDLAFNGSGVVASVHVQPGQRVRAGQVLVAFASPEERLAAERVRHEFELQLVRYLREPSDLGARQGLTSLRAELELAEARLEARLLKAPRDGVVGDVRVRPGQFVSPQVAALSLLQGDSPPVVLAVLPGDARPHLHPGSPLRLELKSFPHEYLEVPIESVGDEIVGPAEVGRYLGPELADALELKGPQVLVRARLPERTFLSGGETYNYFDGMPAQAEVRVRSERVIVTLVPGLKELLHGR